MSNTLSELLRRSARNWPERVALGTATGERAITYAGLDELVTDLAAQLHRRGVGKRDSVAIFSDNCIEYVLALFAVARAGASAAPLNPRLEAPQMIARLRDVSPRATIVPAHLHDEFVTRYPAVTSPAWKLMLGPAENRELSAELVRSQAFSGGSEPAELRPPARPLAGDVALLMLTSGTTAAPKVVPLTHANVLASIDGIRTVYRLTPGDATLLLMPLSHVHGLIAALLATLSSGGAACMPTGGRFRAGRFWSDMAAAGATWYTAVPTIHQILLARAGSDAAKDTRPNLRFVRSCSAPLAPAVMDNLETAFSAPVLTAYGMTETAHQIASNPLPSDGPRKPGSVGVATSVEVEVTGPGGDPAAIGETGEIWIRGASVTSGYVENRVATAQSFTGGWFHSGDLGYKDADGYLFLTGRIKEIINRGGEKISPAAIDEVLQSNPSVEHALSFGVADEKYGEEIQAAVVLRRGHDANEEELTQYCRSMLTASEAPKRIFFVADLPRTAKGSGDRRQLAALLGPAA
jgi:acyl-CoA synthetase (AMP-forming)/AMP-acid ligase II